jgi:hypothetical protein
MIWKRINACSGASRIREENGNPNRPSIVTRRGSQSRTGDELCQPLHGKRLRSQGSQRTITHEKIPMLLVGIDTGWKRTRRMSIASVEAFCLTFQGLCWKETRNEPSTHVYSQFDRHRSLGASFAAG